MTQTDVMAQTDAATNGTGGALPDPVYLGICSTAHDNDPTGGLLAAC